MIKVNQNRNRELPKNIVGMKISDLPAKYFPAVGQEITLDGHEVHILYTQKDDETNEGVVVYDSIEDNWPVGTKVNYNKSDFTVIAVNIDVEIIEVIVDIEICY